MAVRRLSRAAAERLERRTLLAAAPAPAPSAATIAASTISVAIDYSLDANHFFDTQQRRDLLQQAADSVAKWFRDELLAINPGGGDTWEAVFDNPATGTRHTVRNLTVPANQLVLYAGGRDMSDALGRGGPGGFNANGSGGWLDRVSRRGQGGGGPNSVEFGPWGGAITFDTNPSSPWHFGTTTDGLGSENDFLSVASHEVAHLFGFGTSDAWNRQTGGGAFEGPAGLSQYDVDGARGIPVDGTQSHWAEGLRDEGQEVAMDPQLTVGTRRLLTPLDYAALDDVGWSMPPRAGLSAGAVGGGTRPHGFTVTYSHYAPIDASTINAADVTVLAPDGTSLPAALVSTGGTGTARAVSYSVAPPGGTWDAADSGTYAVVLQAEQVRSTTGEAVAPGTLGTFIVDVAAPPVAQLQPTPVPAPAASVHTITVVYTDAVSVDVAGLDANDVVITGPDGTALSGIAFAGANPATPAESVTATYTVPAPGGTWGPEDDGTYAVALRPGEVRDTSGNVAPGGAFGTFVVSLGAVEFDATSPATYTDASGDAVVVLLKGPGTGVVRFTAARPADASAIELHGTTAASSLVVKTGPAGTSVGDVAADGALKSFSAKFGDLTGDLTAGGPLGKVLLRSVGGGAVAAPSVRSITTRGDFGADVTAGTIGPLKIAGTLAGSDVRAASTIGRITAGSVRDSRIFAGLGAGMTQLPDSAAAFVNPAATFAGLTVKSKLPGGFSNSLIAAPSVGKLALGAVQTQNGGAPFGVAADRVAAISAIAVGGVGALKKSRLDDPAVSSADGDFVVRLF